MTRNKIRQARESVLSAGAVRCCFILIVLVGLSVNPQNNLAQATVIFFDDMEGVTTTWTETGFWHRVDNADGVAIFNGRTVPEDRGCTRAGFPNNPIGIFPDLVKLPNTNDPLKGITDTATGVARLPQAFSGTKVWWYGVNSNGTYTDNINPPPGPEPNFDLSLQICKSGGQSSTSNEGSLTSPPGIDLSGFSSPVLKFQTSYEIESADPDLVDQMTIVILTDGGATSTELGSLNPSTDPNGPPNEPLTSGGCTSGDCTDTPYSPKPMEWVEATFPLNAFAGQTIQIRFAFSTSGPLSGDPFMNGFRGWLIDNVRVEGVVTVGAVTIAPMTAEVVTGGELVFEGLVGTGPFVCSVVSDTTGVAAITDDCVFTAGASTGTVTIRIEESGNSANFALATITVVSATGRVTNSLDPRVLEELGALTFDVAVSGGADVFTGVSVARVFDLSLVNGTTYTLRARDSGQSEVGAFDFQVGGACLLSVP